MDLLEDFNAWWRRNSEERSEMGVERLTITQAIVAYAKYKGVDAADIEHAFEDVTREFN